MRHMPHVCEIAVESPTLSGFCNMYINRHKSRIRMKRGVDGVFRGTTSHWNGDWVIVPKAEMQLACQCLYQSPAPPGPFFPDAQPTPTFREWAKVQAESSTAPVWGSAKTNPFVLTPHPSGLPDEELEPCTACGENYASHFGNCPDCLNTGLTPKHSSKRNDIMNTAEMIAVIQIQQGAKIVACSYIGHGSAPAAPGAQVYHFKNVAALPLAKDDLVVVQTRAGYSLATVADPDVRANACGCPLGDLKHVVTKIDLAALNTVLEGENNAMHALALSEVTERMNKFREQIGSNTFDSMAGLLAPPKKAE
jgi:hypothetical protein